MMMRLHKDPDKLAETFHNAYENLAPFFNYSTRKKSRVPWKDVPLPNKDLMIAVCNILQAQLAAEDKRYEALRFDYQTFVKQRELDEDFKGVGFLWSHSPDEAKCACQYQRIWTAYPRECQNCMKVLP